MVAHGDYGGRLNFQGEKDRHGSGVKSDGINISINLHVSDQSIHNIHTDNRAHSIWSAIGNWIVGNTTANTSTPTDYHSDDIKFDSSGFARNTHSSCASSINADDISSDGIDLEGTLLREGCYTPTPSGISTSLAAHYVKSLVHGNVLEYSSAVNKPNSTVHNGYSSATGAIVGSRADGMVLSSLNSGTTGRGSLQNDGSVNLRKLHKCSSIGEGNDIIDSVSRKCEVVDTGESSGGTTSKIVSSFTRDNSYV